MIELVNVWHHYHVDPTLRGIDLTVQPGEVVCVMGPNGMGKSTLMKVTAGILPCFRGSVTIDGEVRRSSIEAEAAIRQKVVYLPDSPWQPRVTARQFLLASGRVYGVDEARLIDHSERLLQLFHLDRHADKRPEDLSAGQTKKLALCSALVTDAPIMLLDEPFSGGLDATGLRAVSELLKHAADDQHRTAMICVPVPELVEGLAHRVAVINHGQLVAFDTIEGLRRQTDCTGDLAEVLERLISEGDDPVQRYLTQEPTS